MIWRDVMTKMPDWMVPGLAYPIIQAPMLGVSGPEMAAAVSNAGGLGSLPVGGLSAAATTELIRETRALTTRPFAVNLFVHEIPAHTDADLDPMRKLLLKLASSRGYDLAGSDLASFRFHTYHEQVPVLIAERIPIVSFTFGCPDKASIQSLSRSGCKLIGTATCVAEALYLEKQDIGCIVVQGIEAGGHRGSFLPGSSLPQVGLFSLLPQVVNAVQIPCIAAGGIKTAEAIKAAFDLGAGAVQIGTAFIGTQESAAIDSYKDKLAKATDTSTVLTRAFSGRWARGLPNELMREIESSGISIPPYPLQNSLTAKFRKLAQQHNDAEYTTLWAGQSGGLNGISSSQEVLEHLVRQYEGLYA